MTPQQVFWNELGVGSYIVGNDGQTWRVLEARAGWLRVENPAGQQLSMPPRDAHAVVTVLSPTPDEAIATFGAVLGATTLAR